VTGVVGDAAKAETVRERESASDANRRITRVL
jgi:hypothetical protein